MTSRTASNTSPASPLRGIYARFGKRATDIAITLLLAPLFLGAIAVVALISIRDRGPLFFSHDRVGRGGARIKVCKIRTMVPDAEARLAAHLASDPAAALEWETHRKLRDDPRITRFGKFLRASSIDELPQIWNVAKGEMSWVGPRPVVRDELEKYGDASASYLSMKPGITGIWQISGRNDESYENRVAMDVLYASRMSLAFDLSVILRTILVVLRKTGR
jgi:exopolysaccharide production protein ExoY